MKDPHGSIPPPLSGWHRLIPDPDAENEAHVVDDCSFMTRERGGVAKFAVVRDPDIGSELPAEFVAKAQPRIEFCQASANGAGRIFLAVEVQFNLGLCDQTIGQQQVVGALYAPGEVTGVSGVERRLYI